MRVFSWNDVDKFFTLNRDIKLAFSQGHKTCQPYVIYTVA